MEWGTRLKTRREALGKRLEALAAQTRINRRFLEALEEGEVTRLPDPIVGRGFLRAYAHALGLEERALLAEYDRAIRLAPDASLEELSRSAPARGGRRNGTLWIGMASAALIVGLIALSEHRSVPPSGPPLERALAPAVSVPEPPARWVTAGRVPQVSRPVSEAQLLPQQGADLISADRLPPSHPLTPTHPVLTLSLTGVERTWVAVRIDGQDPREVLLQPGDRVTWRADRGFVLTLGNAGGVQAQLNGNPLEPFGMSGEVVRDLELPSPAG